MTAYPPVFDDPGLPAVRPPFVPLPADAGPFRAWLATQQQRRIVNRGEYFRRCELERFLADAGAVNPCVGASDYTQGDERDWRPLPPWALAVRQRVDHVGGTVGELVAWLDGQA